MVGLCKYGHIYIIVFSVLVVLVLTSCIIVTKTVLYIFPGDTRGSMDYMLSLYIYTSVICTKDILLTIYRNSGNFQS